MSGNEPISVQRVAVDKSAVSVSSRPKGTPCFNLKKINEAEEKKKRLPVSTFL